MRGVETKESHHASATPTPAGGEEPSPTKTNGREQAETQPQAQPQTQLQPQRSDESCCQDKKETQVNLSLQSRVVSLPCIPHHPHQSAFSHCFQPLTPLINLLPTQFPYESMACQLKGLCYVPGDYIPLKVYSARNGATETGRGLVYRWAEQGEIIAFRYSTGSEAQGSLWQSTTNQLSDN